jgi:ribosomal protein S18 acetylase RimI-like enzyme
VEETAPEREVDCPFRQLRRLLPLTVKGSKQRYALLFVLHIMTIRKIKTTDTLDIIEMYGELMRTHELIDSYYKPRKPVNYEEEIERIESDENSFIFVAEEEESIIGFITMSVRDFKDRAESFLYISDIFVKKMFRNSGVGKALLEKAQEIAKSKNIKRLELQVDIQNVTGVDFWGHQGFEKAMLRMKKLLEINLLYGTKPKRTCIAKGRRRRPFAILTLYERQRRISCKS